MWCRANEQAWPETSEKAQRAGGEKGNRDGDPVVSGPALSFTEWLPLKWLVAEGVVYLGAVQREGSVWQPQQLREVTAAPLTTPCANLTEEVAWS